MKKKILTIVLSIIMVLSIIISFIFFTSCITQSIGVKIGGIILSLFFLFVASFIVYFIKKINKKPAENCLSNDDLSKNTRLKNKLVVCLLVLFSILTLATGWNLFKPENKYADYDTYSYKNIFLCKVPDSWEHKKISGTDYYYKNQSDSVDGMLFFGYTSDFDISITDKNNFEDFLSGVKESEGFSGIVSTSDKKVAGINGKQFIYTSDASGENCYIITTLFDCGSGFGYISFATHKKGDYSDYYNNILDSLVIKKKHTFETTETETTTEVTTTEATTEDDTSLDDDEDDSDSAVSSDDIHNKIKKDFISNCKTYPYKSLIRYQSKYDQKPVKYTVEVVQIMKDGSDTYYRAYVSDDALDNEFYIKDLRSSSASDYLDIVKNDTITIYGRFNGMKTLTRAISGVSEKVPCIYMQYADLK